MVACLWKCLRRRLALKPASRQGFSNGFAAAHLDAKQCLLFLAGGDVEPHDELSGADLGRSLASRKIGFELLYGGERTAFSSLRAGEAFVNLVTSPGYEPRQSDRPDRKGVRR